MSCILNFTYDLFNTTTTTAAVGCPNPGAITPACANGSSSGLFPNQITKINIMHMDMDSSVNGSGFAQKGYSRMDLQTSVSARNLTYVTTTLISGEMTKASGTMGSKAKGIENHGNSGA